MVERTPSSMSVPISQKGSGAFVLGGSGSGIVSSVSSDIKSATTPTSQSQYYTAFAEDVLTELRKDPIKQCHDCGWAVAFIMHFIVLSLLVAAGFLNNSLAFYYNSRNDDEDVADDDAFFFYYANDDDQEQAQQQQQQRQYQQQYSSLSASEGGSSWNMKGDLMFMVAITGLCSIATTSFCVTLMMKHTKFLVQTGLLLSIIISALFACYGFFIHDSVTIAVIGVLGTAFGMCYARIVWKRIPFATQNLKTSLIAIQRNMGVTGVAYGFTALAFLWVICWFVGIARVISIRRYFTIFLFFLSYYWVHQVLKNMVNVTTAATVSSWWFQPEDASGSFWMPATTDGLIRSFTYSFGSICFGSFLVPFVQAIRSLDRYASQRGEYNMIACLIRCLLSCIQGAVECIHKWAYVYCAVYGFGYMEAGKNVMELFKCKGFASIITDDLTDNVLFLMAVANGVIAGSVALIFSLVDELLFIQLGFDDATIPAFLVGFLTGFLISSVIMSVVGSAVNTVVVCYLEEPAAFLMHHPQLAADMRGAWIEAWPNVTHL